MGEEETRRLIELLETEHIKYKLYEHEPVFTSEQAARVRGVELKTGVKAMVLKKSLSGNDELQENDETQKDRFLVADIAADRKLDFKRLEKLFDPPVRKVGFATKQEVVAVTGCEAGSVHPIGWLFGLDTYLDESVLENEFVNFNIGLLTKSVRLGKGDFMRILKPKSVGSFSKPGTSAEFS